MRYDTPFQQLTADEEAWLNRWQHEGAKELAVEALHVCIDLVRPAARQVEPSLSENERLAVLQRWNGVYYPATSFKDAIDNNISTAFELNRLAKVVGDDSALLTAAASFFQGANREYARLTASGMPDGLNFWRRIRPRLE